MKKLLFTVLLYIKKSSIKLKTITVKSLNGQILQTLANPKGNQKIAVSNWSSGVYWIDFDFGEQGRLVRKIVVNHE